MRIAFFGSSLVSSYWNGACTYYRGIIRALHRCGHTVTFYEPDILGRQQHRDIEDPPYATVVVYDPVDTVQTVRAARGFDVVIKASGVGAGDAVLEEMVLELSGLHVFWDVDAPATLARMESDPGDSLRGLISHYDLVLTYGGGQPVIARYQALGARSCVPIYNALDPDTHHPVAPESRFDADLAFLGNRLPDREARVQEFFFAPVRDLPDQSFVLGGEGWRDHPPSANLRYLGHVGTAHHNALNCTPLAVLNVCRESMAENGFSPPTRLFEAAGAGACLITDAWEGIELFLAPETEVLVARDGAEVCEHLRNLDRASAAEIGARARRRICAQHSYAQRAELVEASFAACR